MRWIGTIDWLYRWNRPTLALISQMDGTSEAILYGSDDSSECVAMIRLLDELGVDYVYRQVNRDPAAMREWELLDGDRVPLLRMGRNTIVRGFDRIKVQQMLGWVGC